MKTTKRSKMLISSIAMLLVALVALGSATYAWYTLNKTVYATPLSVTASAPEGLLISNDNSTWAGTTTLAKAAAVTDLNPVSISVNASGAVATSYKATATAVNAYGATSYESVTATQDGTTGIYKAGGLAYYVIDTLYVKSTGKDDVEVKCAVKYNNASAPTGTFMNLAIVDTTANNGSGKILGYVTSDGTSSTYVDSTSTTAAQTKLVASANYAWMTGDASTGVTYTKDDVHTIKVIAYADGQNNNCYTLQDAATTAVSYNIAFSYDTTLVS